MYNYLLKSKQIQIIYKTAGILMILQVILLISKDGQGWGGGREAGVTGKMRR